MADAKNRLTANANVLNVMNANPDLSFSASDLRAMQAGTLITNIPIPPGGILVPPQLPSFAAGCIRALRYGNSDTDLTRIEFLDGTAFSNTQIVNLNAFRERLQEAANFGHRVVFCINTTTKKMFMLNIRPCECLCEKRDPPTVLTPSVPIPPPVIVAP